MENTGKTVEYPFLWGKVVEIPARRSVMRPMDPAKRSVLYEQKAEKEPAAHHHCADFGAHPQAFAPVPHAGGDRKSVV